MKLKTVTCITMLFLLLAAGFANAHEKIETHMLNEKIDKLERSNKYLQVEVQRLEELINTPNYLLCGIMLGGEMKCGYRVYDSYWKCRMWGAGGTELAGSFVWMCVPGGRR